MFVKEEEEEEEEAKVDLMVVHMEYFVVTEAKKQKGYQVQIQNCNENYEVLLIYRKSNDNFIHRDNSIVTILRDVNSITTIYCRLSGYITTTIYNSCLCVFLFFIYTLI